jgi:competence protein ComEC
VGDGIYLKGRGEVPQLWSVVVGRLTAWLPASAGTAGGFDNKRYLAGRNLLWEGRLQALTGGERLTMVARLTAGDPLAELVSPSVAKVRAMLLSIVDANLPPREAGLIASVLLGQRDALSNQTRQPFARLGLAHLFAVSGLHVGIILAILGALTRPLAPSPWFRLCFLIGILPLYVVLTGMSSSVLRASCLAGLVLMATVCGRRCDPLYALGLLFWLNCQVAPWTVLDTGCRLSYLAAVGIVGVHQLCGCQLPRRPAWRRWLLAGLSVTLSAQWFTLPEIVASFGWVNPLAPLANLVAVPVFTMAVWLAVLGLILFPWWAWPAESLFALSWLLLRCLAAGAETLAQILPVIGAPPWSPWRLATYLALSGMLLRQLARGSRSARSGRYWRLGRCLVLVGALVGLLPLGRSTLSGRMTAWQFDVGQGDCALLVFPDRNAVLIDTGLAWPGGSALARSVLPLLEREGIRRLGTVVLTHDHDDHTGGLDALISRLSVDFCWLGGSTAEHELPGLAGVKTFAPRRGDILYQCGVWSLHCLHPPGQDSSVRLENDRSLVLVLRRGQAAVALWSGDLERAGEQALLASSRDRLDSGLQVWKAGHHGSDTSGSASFLGWIRPRLIVASCGVENRHGHPSHGPYVVAGDTIPLLRTDLDGSVRLQWRDDGTLYWHTVRGKHGRIKAVEPRLDTSGSHP